MQVTDTQGYNGFFTIHATLMIFLFIIPAFAGLANYVVPLMLGAPDMAFPRLNALSFWLLPIAGTMLIGSFLAPGGPPAAGWTATRRSRRTNPWDDLLQHGGAVGGRELDHDRAQLPRHDHHHACAGMTFWRMPLLVWANFTTSLLVVLATPFIAGSQFFVMFDR
jgi:cytochrome c oxidase subunit 1